MKLKKRHLFKVVSMKVALPSSWQQDIYKIVCNLQTCMLFSLFLRIRQNETPEQKKERSNLHSTLVTLHLRSLHPYTYISLPFSLHLMFVKSYGTPLFDPVLTQSILTSILCEEGLVRKWAVEKDNRLYTDH